MKRGVEQRGPRRGGDRSRQRKRRRVKWKEAEGGRKKREGAERRKEESRNAGGCMGEGRRKLEGRGEERRGRGEEKKRQKMHHPREQERSFLSYYIMGDGHLQDIHNRAFDSGLMGFCKTLLLWETLARENHLYQHFYCFIY